MAGSFDARALRAAMRSWVRIAGAAVATAGTGGCCAWPFEEATVGYASSRVVPMPARIAQAGYRLDAPLPVPVCRAACEIDACFPSSLVVAEGVQSAVIVCNDYTPPACTGSGFLDFRVPSGRRSARLGAHAGEAFAALARAEAASVDDFVELAASLRVHGAPAALVTRAQRAAREEVGHAWAMSRLAEHHGFAHAAPAAPARRVRSVPTLLRLARENAVRGCVGETWGAFLLALGAARARDPEVQRALWRIALDEARHAALAFSIHRWAAPRIGAAARASIEAAMARALARLGARPPRISDEVRRALGSPTALDCAAVVPHVVAFVTAATRSPARPRRTAPKRSGRGRVLALVGALAVAGCGSEAQSVVVHPPGALVVAKHRVSRPYTSSRVTYEVLEAPSDGRLALHPPTTGGALTTSVSVFAPGCASATDVEVGDGARIDLVPVASGREERFALSEARASFSELEAACATGTLAASGCRAVRDHLERRSARARTRWPDTFEPTRVATPTVKSFGAILVDSWKQLRDAPVLLESGVELEDGALALLEASLRDRNLEGATRSVVVLGTDRRIRFIASLDGSGPAALAAWGEGDGVIGVTSTHRTSWDAAGGRLASRALDPPLLPHERVKDAVAVGPWRGGEGDVLVAVHHVLEGSNGADVAPVRLDRYDAGGKRVASRSVPDVVLVSSLSVGPGGAPLLFGDLDYARRRPPPFALPRFAGRDLVAARTQSRVAVAVPWESSAPTVLLGSSVDAWTSNGAAVYALVVDAQPRDDVSTTQAIRRTFLLRMAEQGTVEASADRTDPELRREAYRFVRPRPGGTRAILVFHRDVDDRGGDLIELTPPP